LIGAALSPFIAFFGNWVGYRADMDCAGSEAELEISKTFYRRLALGLASIFVAFGLLLIFGESLKSINGALLIGLYAVIGVAYAVFVTKLMLWWTRSRRDYLASRPELTPVVKTGVGVSVPSHTLRAAPHPLPRRR
jgi:hypothetical protein